MLSRYPDARLVEGGKFVAQDHALCSQIFVGDQRRVTIAIKLQDATCNGICVSHALPYTGQCADGEDVVGIDPVKYVARATMQALVDCVCLAAIGSLTQKDNQRSYFPMIAALSSLDPPSMTIYSRSG